MSLWSWECRSSGGRFRSTHRYCYTGLRPDCSRVRAVSAGRSGECTLLADPAFVVISRSSAKDLGLDTFVIALLFFYLNGLVPALITAAFDAKRARGIAMWLATGSFGYAAAYVNILAPLLLHQPKWVWVGAIPAAICSAITDLTMTRTKESLRA